MSNTLIRDAVRAALGVGVAATITVSPSAFGQQEDPVQLGRIVTTGTRISRLDVEAARPLTVISREDIERSGQPTVSDVLRSTTYNTFGEFRETSGNSFGGQALVGLKGLGSTRTLVLLNGRRLPNSPVTADQAIDLNTIPLEAVERIEILTDSASAIYGSDAIGGVINVILRDDFEGVQLRTGFGRPSQEGADTQGSSIVFGSSTGRGSFIVSAETYKKDMIFSRDRPFSAPDFGDGVNLGTTEGINDGGNTLLDFFGDGGNGGPDRGDPNCDSVVDANGNPLFAGLYQDGPNQSCAYAYAAIAGETQDISRDSVFINASYEITPDITATYTGTYSQVEAFGRYAAAIGGFCIDLDQIPNLDPAWQDLQGINTLDCDGVNPDIDAVLLHRFVGVGPRDDQDTNVLFDNQLTFEGTAGMFDWNVWAGTTVYTGKSRGYNYVRTSAVEAAVANGTYNPLDPLSSANDDAYAQFRHTVTRDIETDYKRVGGSVSFDAGELPAGPIGWAVGTEYFDQEFRDVYDPAREAQDVIGSAGNSTAGERSNYAVFAETLLPLTDTLELSVAARYDDYDDSAGSETTPFLALRYRPTESWLFRASWGEGFRAPNMTNLYSATSFSAEPAVDLVFCEQENIVPCADDQVDSFSGGNDQLAPELSESYNLGIGWANDRMSVSADYWNIEITEALTIPTAQDLIDLEFEGRELPPGASITRDASGAISNCLPGQTEGCGVARPWLNLSRQDYTGLDIRFDYNLPLSGGAGDLNFRWIHSHILEALEQTTPTDIIEDVAGEQDKPEFRSVLVTEWARGNHSVSLIVNHIDGYTNSNEDRVNSMTTTDVQWTWDVIENGRLVLGVLNIADEDPPLDPFNDTAQVFNSEIYGFDGRVPYLSYRHSF
jgi:iron complex outermembrane receptor protein